MNRFAILRREHGWNMKEAAQHFDLAYTTYVGYEKGERTPSFDLVCRMAEFYDVDVTYLMGTSETRGHFPSHEGAYGNEMPATENSDGLDQELARYLRRLTPEEALRVTAYVQGLLASRGE